MTTFEYALYVSSVAARKAFADRDQRIEIPGCLGVMENMAQTGLSIVAQSQMATLSPRPIYEILTGCAIQGSPGPVCHSWSQCKILICRKSDRTRLSGSRFAGGFRKPVLRIIQTRRSSRERAPILASDHAQRQLRHSKLTTEHAVVGGERSPLCDRAVSANRRMQGKSWNQVREACHESSFPKPITFIMHV